MTFLALFLAACLVAAVAGVIRQRHMLWESRQQALSHERERATILRFLNQLGERITTSIDLEATLNLVVGFCIDATKADAGAIFIRSRSNPGMLQARVVQGLFPPLHEVATDKLASKRKYLAEYVKKERLRVGEGIIGLVAQTGEAMLIPDAALDSRVPRSAGELVELRDLILVPLVTRGQVRGVLVLINKREDGRVFDEADKGLVSALADQAAVTLDIVRLYEEVSEKQRLEQELRVAHEVQEVLLPKEIPQVATLEIAGASRSAMDVGGDYYDYFWVDEGHLGVVVADVAGKGIPGALVMATLRSTLRAEARGDRSPRSVLRRVNEHLVRDTRESIFVSVLYGIVDVQTGELVFCRAGHEPLVVCESPQGGPIRQHSPPGMVVGMIDGPAFDLLEEERLDLRACGAVLMNTDGATEAMNAQGDELGQEALEAAVARAAPGPVQAIVDAVMHAVDAHAAGTPQHDDITLVVLRWKGERGLEASTAGEPTLAQTRNQP